MKMRILSFFLMLYILFSAAGCAAPAGPDPAPAQPAVQEPAILESEPGPAPQLSEREQNWRADIKYLRDEFKKYHPDPFRYCTEEEFDWKFEQLMGKINELSDNDIQYEMAAIIAGLGDNHSRVIRPNAPSFPVIARYLGDHLYICSYLEGYDQFAPYLLREVVAVNGVDISYILQKAASITGPNNYTAAKELFFLELNAPLLDWAGCDYKEGYVFQILNENQEVVSVEMPTVSEEECSEGEWIFSEAFDLAYSPRTGNWTEYFTEEAGDYVYMALSDLYSYYEQPYRELFENTAQLLQTHPDCDTLVIDLRRNPGGYSQYIRDCTQLLKETPAAHTYVLITGYSASAAMRCLAVFKEELGAVSVGEPSGQFTSCFTKLGGITPSVLPHYPVSFVVASLWHEGPAITTPYYDETGNLYEWENTILPDVYVHQDIEDIRQGKDSVIQWILSQ